MERGDTKLGIDPGTARGVTGHPVVIESLFDEATHEAINRFLDERVPLLALGVPLGTDQTDFGRNYANNVPFFVKIHQQLTDLASDLFSEPVKPSYSYLSMYQDDGICPLHIDRPQCRYTIDYLIRQTQSEPWPILIGEHMSDDDQRTLYESGRGRPETPEEIEARIAAEKWSRVELKPNDAVCYSGTHSWHYRPDRLRGTADLVFFHFVPVAFDGPLS
jgi:hypothetical protein